MPAEGRALRRLAGVLSLMLGVICLLVPRPAEAQKRDRDLITRREILASSHRTMDIYQVIRSLRPHFLAPPRGVRTLGAAPPAPAIVYVDGTRSGELDALRSISALAVEEVRYLDPSKAENQFGVQASGGALLVKLFKGPKPDTGPPVQPPERH